MEDKEKDERFYWICVVFSLGLYWNHRKISDFLESKGYSCGKSNFLDAVLCYIKHGTPAALGSGRPREQGIGKCPKYPPCDIMDGKKCFISRKRKKYQDVAKEIDCSIA